MKGIVINRKEKDYVDAGRGVEEKRGKGSERWKKPKMKRSGVPVGTGEGAGAGPDSFERS